jgi:hypothetical protein
MLPFVLSLPALSVSKGRRAGIIAFAYALIAYSVTWYNRPITFAARHIYG